MSVLAANVAPLILVAPEIVGSVALLIRTTAHPPSTAPAAMVYGLTL